jgi:hypothetical protein
MGFLSKLMKNPMMQMLAPMAISMAIPGLGQMFSAKGAFGGLGLGSLFGNMNPLAANALKQGLIGYGTGLATGAEKPGKQAAYAGLASMLPSYMAASRQAKDFNKMYAGVPGKSRIMTQAPQFDPMDLQDIISQERTPFKPQFTGRYADIAAPKSVTPWEILSTKGGVTRDIPAYEDLSTMILDPSSSERLMPSLTDPRTENLTADIFTKTIPGEATPMDAYGNVFMSPPETKSDFLPTAFSQAVGAGAEYMETADVRSQKKWARDKEKRKKELAWMYGVPEDMITGEMANPWSSGRGLWNKGGIASLQNGGDVNGPGTGTSDSIDAKLSDGEFVMTAKAVENLGGGDRYEGARKMYGMMNMLDPESESMQEVV